MQLSYELGDYGPGYQFQWDFPKYNRSPTFKGAGAKEEAASATAADDFPLAEATPAS